MLALQRGANLTGTSKMKISFIVASIFLLAACSSTSPPAPAPQASTRAPDDLVAEKEITLSSDGEVVLSLRASASGTAWNRANAEAATISIHVDGMYKADVVLFRGETLHTYETLAGNLSAGKHRVTVLREPAKSAPQANKVRVNEITANVYARTDPLYQVMAHAPILYGRDESRYSDVPLFMYHEITRDQTTTTIQYTIVFSNEDGGTAPEGLMARWGRLTDIEWVYRVILNAQGEATRGEYQDKDHNTAIFRGVKDGQHPFLKNVVKNNLFADSGTSLYRFALAPTESLPEASREEMMDRHPWMYRVMGEEWEREGTEQAGNPETRTVSSPRNYLYLEFRSEPIFNPSCDAKLAFQVKLRGSDRWFSSDHGADSLRIQSQGWRRSAIELPPGTTANQVEALRFVVYPGKNLPQCTVAITDVRKAFLLNQDYAPSQSLLTWNGQQILGADNAMSYPAQWILPVGQ